MIGKFLNAECEMRNAESKPVYGFRALGGVLSFFKFRSPQSAIRNQRGFSLLELMIAMFIMIILLSVALPTYQRSVQHARELVLEENLWQMRRAIDQYGTDKGKLPQSLDDLKTGGYLRDIPVDPISEKAEWNPVMGEDVNSKDGGQGVINVKSTAEGEDSDGKKYEEY